MIDFESLRKEYEKAVGYNVFSEEGEVIDFYRKSNQIVKPICGVYSVNPMTMTALRKPFIGVVSADVTLIAPPDKWEEVRKKLNEVAQTLNGTTSRMLGNDGEEYSVSYNFQACSVGDRILDYAGGAGEAFPITQSVSYIIIEGGMSAYDVKMTIDGKRVPILTMVESKVHTTSMYAGENGEGRTASEMESYGIDFTAPFTNDDASKMLSEAIDEVTANIAHSVCVEKNGRKRCRIMAISNISDSVSPPQNVGFNVSLTELHPAAAEFDGRWASHVFPGSWCRFYPVKIAEKEPNVVGIDVYWGDGDSESYEGLPASLVHYYSDGAEAHTVRIFKRYDSDWVNFPRDRRVNVLGETIKVREGAEVRPNPQVIEDVWLSNEDGTRKIVVLSGQFYQVVDGGMIGIGETDENGNYLPGGYEFQCALDNVKSSTVSTGAANYFQIPTRCIYVDFPEG